VATHLAAAAATLGWMFAEWIKTGKPTVLGAISGAVGGLVVITPAAGFVGPMAAIIMGAIGGVVCFFAATVVKHAIGYDDSLDAFGVHGVGGTVGAILTGIFASAAYNPAIKRATDTSEGWVSGNPGQVLNQILAVAITIVFAIVGSVIILFITKLLTGGLRLSEEDEFTGLDLTQHGESGYNFEEEFGGTLANGGSRA
jgi:Amt family ammonium transporter